MTAQIKTPEPVAPGAEGSLQNIMPPKYMPLPPRLERLLSALLYAADGLSREQCDRVTPCSNSPEYISRLRQALGLAIPCERRSFITLDGTRSNYGVYHLSNEDRAKLALVLP